MHQEIKIISDLWGVNQSDWFENFEQLLSENYDVQLTDACKLAGLDLDPYTQEHLHQQFIDFGIDKAAIALVKRNTTPKIYIGCSIGGVIAWKASKLGLKVKKLITISSTRLRYETVKPDFGCCHFFGHKDKYKPDTKWINTVGQNSTQIVQGGHEIYKRKEVVEQILREAELLNSE